MARRPVFRGSVQAAATAGRAATSCYKLQRSRRKIGTQKSLFQEWFEKVLRNCFADQIVVKFLNLVADMEKEKPWMCFFHVFFRDLLSGKFLQGLAIPDR